MARKRGVRSSVEMLDPELIELVNQLVRDGYTIREMVEELKELGAHISKSSMGRYAKRVSDHIEKAREAHEVARYWGDVLTKDPDSDMGHMLSEQLRVAAFNTLLTLNEKEKPASTKDLMFLASTIKNLSSTAKTDIDVALLRKRIQAEAKATAKEVGEVVRNAGMSDKSAKEIMTKILGIAKN